MSAGFGYYRAFAQDRIDNQELGKTKLTLPVLASSGSQGGGTRDFTENNLRQAAENVRGFLSWFYQHDAYNPIAINQRDIDEYVRCYAAPGGMRVGFEYYRASHQDAEHNKENAKLKLTIPVLAIGGDRSVGNLAIAEMEQVAENVRGSLIKDCRHFVPEEHPDTLAQQLLTFFAQENR